MNKIFTLISLVSFFSLTANSPEQIKQEFIVNSNKAVLECLKQSENTFAFLIGYAEAEMKSKSSTDLLKDQVFMGVYRHYQG